MPLNFTENIAIFIHNEKANSKRIFNNISQSIEIDKSVHFCRWYAQQMLKFINKPRRKIHSELGHRKLEFWFYYTGEHFGILSEVLYNQLIDKYQINKWKDFVSYSHLKEIWNNEKKNSSGIKLEGSKYSNTLNNVLNVAKENIYLHPTQKPVELMEKLVLMYSNEGCTVLDCFMGSGSTGVAAIRNNRNFLGCELDKKYFDIAVSRIENEQ
ncbi:site-specific DNA-methyltransferase [Mycoplasmopsis mucosicanis]|uniref:Methyltransferase n=2 Tax=Mycoplasmopsis mucosicanis TaxID=458208 RepID=A0A507SSK1_9BACT|nr:site-specific DNA-methyltransferase [Mycoplasmopsis mucosicanis]